MNKSTTHKRHRPFFGPMVFLATAAGILFFFWWLLIYSHGVHSVS